MIRNLDIKTIVEIKKSGILYKKNENKLYNIEKVHNDFQYIITLFKIAKKNKDKTSEKEVKDYFKKLKKFINEVVINDLENFLIDKNEIKIFIDVLNAFLIATKVKEDIKNQVDYSNEQNEKYLYCYEMLENGINFKDVCTKMYGVRIYEK